MYQADQSRYTVLPYRRCGSSGLLLPAVSLGLWHNFGDTAPYENMRALCRNRARPRPTLAKFCGTT